MQRLIIGKNLGRVKGGRKGKVPGSGAVRRSMAHDELREEGRVRPKNVWTVLRSFDIVFFFFLNKCIYLFIYLFLAVLGLRCCARAFL